MRTSVPRDKVHEAVCAAAGWPAYCDHCGGRMRRVTQLGVAVSACTDPHCYQDRLEAAALAHALDDGEEP